MLFAVGGKARHIGEADSANVFAVIDGVAATPPLSRGILPGTTRAFALEALRNADRPCAERVIRRLHTQKSPEIA